MTRLMSRNLLIPFVVLPFVSGCNSDSLIKMAYPDRERHSVFSEVTEQNNIFLCAPGKTEAETRVRANQANRMFEAYLDEEAGKLAAAILEDDDFSMMDSFSAAWKMNSAAEDLVERMDAELQCVPLEE